MIAFAGLPALLRSFPHARSWDEDHNEMIAWDPSALCGLGKQGLTVPTSS